MINAQIHQTPVTLVRMACVAAAAAMLASCSAGNPTRNVDVDQVGLLEAGRSMELAEVTVRLAQRFHQQNPAAWQDLLSRSSRLSQRAGRLVLDRATAVADTASSDERFEQLKADAAALLAEREALANDLERALPPAP